jgi:hypothetical protein
VFSWTKSSGSFCECPHKHANLGRLCHEERRLAHLAWATKQTAIRDLAGGFPKKLGIREFFELLTIWTIPKQVLDRGRGIAGHQWFLQICDLSRLTSTGGLLLMYFAQ